jgi:hypothetical protein
MAKVNWSAGIDSVSGALAKPSKSGQHSCNKMLLGTHRTAATTNPDCNRIYMRKPTKRSTPLTSNEIEARDKFTAVAKAVNERAHDLSKVSADQEAFLAQRNEPGGKKTIKSWYWYVCGKEYDEANT